jgi:hypothetical protein
MAATRGPLRLCGELLLDCNAVICHWMPASNSGCEHLYLDGALASAWRFSPLDLGHPLLDAGFVDDAAVQAERDHAIVAQLPDSSLWIPRPTGLLHPVADCHVGNGDA